MRAPDSEVTWEDCADTHISEATDFELTEYLPVIGASVELTLDESYWPGDNPVLKS